MLYWFGLVLTGLFWLLLMVVGSHRWVTPILRPVAEMLEDALVLLFGWLCSLVVRGWVNLRRWLREKRKPKPVELGPEPEHTPPFPEAKDKP